MSDLASARDIAQMILTSSDLATLQEALEAASDWMGFHFFALTQHPRRDPSAPGGMRVHNYPREWEVSYDRRRLGLSDPVHRASHLRADGFRWRELRAIIPFFDRDEEMLSEALVFEIEDGLTIPVNVPGEPCGSVTFAIRSGQAFPEERLMFADNFAAISFQTMRMIAGLRPAAGKPRLTDHQLEVVRWVAVDKTDAEIAQILDVKTDTVSKHIRNACRSFGVYKRTSLPIHALFEGMLAFSDVLF